MSYQSQTPTLAYDLRTDVDPLLERIGDARYVLLGEASHGTHEYYTWRARISKRLIEEKGFSFIGVEGDWPDCYGINRFVKGHADSPAEVLAVLRGFERWPTWMWANYEIAALATCVRQFNGQTNGKKLASMAWMSTACGNRWAFCIRCCKGNRALKPFSW